jgi:fructose-1,6-bisphosphatase/inositol monophosphatase family enzyme
VSYSKELVFAKNLALEAGGIMRHYFRTNDTQTTWKHKNDPLTIADTTINSLVIERVIQKFPDHGVIGEEEVYNGKKSIVWLVDPIDGTLPYILGMPTAVFMIALIIDGKPVLSVIYNAWMDLLYYAVKGEGAFCNERKLQITISDTDIVELVLWKGSVYRQKVLPVRQKLEDRGLSPQNYVGGIAKTALVENHLRGFIYADDSPWDVAPFDLLVHEAGGIVTDLSGRTLEYNGPIEGAIAGSSQTHGELLELLNKK